MKLSMKKTLLRVLVLFVWIFGGSWIFVLAEYKTENESKLHILKELYYNMSTKYNMTLAEFESFALTVHDALTIPKRQWTYVNSVDFALQTVTTIGYGTITPKTPMGQIFCVFYALIGIPIAMLTLTSVGGLISDGFATIIRKTGKLILKRDQIKDVEIKCTVVICVVMLLYLLAAATIQVYYEELTFIEAIYMWFITFSTVGYGDYYPGISWDRPPNQSNFTLNYVEGVETDIDTGAEVMIEIVGTVFFILGLCLMSAVLNAIVTTLEKQRCKTCAGFVSRQRRARMSYSLGTLETKSRNESQWNKITPQVGKSETDTAPSSVPLELKFNGCSSFELTSL